MSDQLGISQRLIREFQPPSGSDISVHDRAFSLACADKRDVPFGEKLQDAYEFIVYQRRASQEGAQ